MSILASKLFVSTIGSPARLPLCGSQNFINKGSRVLPGGWVRQFSRVSPAGGQKAGTAMAPPLVHIDYLKERLGDPNVKILDATWYMPGSERSGAAEFKEERIPGAGFFDLDRIADTSLPLPHIMPTEKAFAAAADALGIRNIDEVVVYDRHGIFSAPRVWWTFKVFGHEDVAVLDGGFPAWKEAGYPVDVTPLTNDVAEAPAEAAQHPPPETRYVAKYHPDLVRSLDDMVRIAETHEEEMVDARSHDRWAGRVDEPRPGLRRGHIPGAKSVPFNKVLTADGRHLLPEDKLGIVFDEAGVDLSKPAVCYCGSGVTACIDLLALRLLPDGPPHLALYDGSWAEWGARRDVPVETAT